MTIAEAALIPWNTEEFEVAVESLSEAVADGDKAAEPVLAYLLQRNDDSLMGARFGLRA